MSVSFTLDDDQRHVIWQHDCIPYDVSHLDEETARISLELQAKPHPLPLGPDAWTLVSADPITVTPSILCVRCGIHGFITNGKWVSV